MRPIIEKDLGKRVAEVFSSINTVPLASASIAQVCLDRRDVKMQSIFVLAVKDPSGIGLMAQDTLSLPCISRVR